MGLLSNMIETAAKTAAKTALINAVGDAVSKTAGVVMEHETIGATGATVKVPRSSDSYHGMNCFEVEEELRAYGFVNIALLAKRDLINGWMTKPGSVEEVSIAGKTSFKKGQKVSLDARIVIIYHDFRQSRI